MAMNFAPIPMPQSGMDAFYQGAANTQSMIDSMVRNRQMQAATQAQLAKNPYVGAQAAADLQGTKNINQWYGPKATSEIGLQGAQAGLAGAQAGLQGAETNLKRQQYENPGLTGSGVEHEQAVLSLLLNKHPELARQLHNEVIASHQAPAASLNELSGGQGSSVTNAAPNTPITAAEPGAQQPAAPAAPAMPTAPVAQAGDNSVKMTPVDTVGTAFDTKNGVIPQPNSADGFNPADVLKRNMEAEIKGKENRYLGLGRGGVTQQAQRQMQTDVKRDNPNFTDDQVFEASGNILRGQDSLADGTPINKSGMTEQDAINVQKSGATAAVKNQASNYDVLVSDMKGIDIDALKQFAGPMGKVKLAMTKAKMASNPNDPSIDPVARRALTAINQTIITMDSMRKAWGTSVVPDYVYNTIGKLSNPNSDLWQDPKQVEQTYKETLKTITKNRDEMMKKVRGGITAKSDESSSSSGIGEPSAATSSTPSVQWIRKDGKLVRAN